MAIDLIKILWFWYGLVCHVSIFVSTVWANEMDGNIHPRE